METTIDQFGRIVIPKKIREAFNLKAGVPIRIEEHNDTLVLKPIFGEPNLIVKEGVLVYSGNTTENIEESVEENRLERMKSLGGEYEDVV